MHSGSYRLRNEFDATCVRDIQPFVPQPLCSSDLLALLPHVHQLSPINYLGVFWKCTRTVLLKFKTKASAQHSCVNSNFLILRFRHINLKNEEYIYLLIAIQHFNSMFFTDRL